MPAETLRDGLVGWSSIDAPWLAHMDRGALGCMLESLERLDPDHVLSGHLLVARGIRTLTDLVATAYGGGTSDAVTPDDIAQVEAALG